LSKNGIQLVPMSAQNSSSQAAPIPKPLLVTRTTQVPPDCASTRNSDVSGLRVAGSLPMRAAQSSS
jgi:hypothetical protein